MILRILFIQFFVPCCINSRTSSAGYKAAEWGDMEAFLWKGRLRILERGSENDPSNSTKCFIRLEDADTGQFEVSFL
jgi:hypothetical protein